jgi:type IV pilus assembly protein PilQ
MNAVRRCYPILFVAAVLGLAICPTAGFGAEVEGVAETEVTPGAEGAIDVLEEELGTEEAVETTVAISPAGIIPFVEYKDAPLPVVLKQLAETTKVNIVMTRGVIDANVTVTIRLENVNWRKALQLILELNKLEMTEDKEDNIIKVMTESEVAAEPMTTKVYPLNYLQAADHEISSVEYMDGKRKKTTKTEDGAMTMLKPFLAENETIEADAGGNKLIVHALPTTHERLKEVLGECDKQSQQVLIEVKLIEATTEAGKNLGIKWDFLREYGVGSSDMTRSYVRDLTKGDLAKSYSTDDSTLNEALSEASARTNSSLSLAGTGVLADQTGSSRIGGFDTLSGMTRDITHSATLGSARNFDWDAQTNILKTATLSADNVRLVLSALYEDASVKLVSNPRISTVHSRAATIRAVKEWPIPNWSFNADTGTWEVQGFDSKDIGITLRVTPYVNQDNFVTLDVDPEVSNLADTVTFGGGASGTAEIPVIDSRNALTRVIVKSGETLVIGGLVKTDEVLRKSGVPLLKDIPLLGNVFKHSSKTTMNFDLLVFITPTIVEGSSASVLSPPAGAIE